MEMTDTPEPEFGHKASGKSGSNRNGPVLQASLLKRLSQPGEDADFDFEPPRIDNITRRIDFD